MGINKDKPDKWKQDTALSVEMYNEWYMNFAPKTFRETRKITSVGVEEALRVIGYFKELTPDVLKKNPEILPVLRMSTCPPIARDRLVGLSGVSRGLVQNMEDGENPRVSPRMSNSQLEKELSQIINIVNKMVDSDVFVWVGEEREPLEVEIVRSATIIADRLCATVSDPIIRNAQEKRQIEIVTKYLKDKGYIEAKAGTKFNEMPPGTYAFRTNVKVKVAADSEQMANIPVDVLVNPLLSTKGALPIMIECKSAGDFANVNKRRKEEATKMQQLKNTYGEDIKFVLFLCGYFDSAYLGYEAAEGIDWIWEHRISDMALLGI